MFLTQAWLNEHNSAMITFQKSPLRFHFIVSTIKGKKRSANGHCIQCQWQAAFIKKMNLEAFLLPKSGKTEVFVQKKQW